MPKRRRPRQGGVWPTRRSLDGCYVHVAHDDNDKVTIAFPAKMTDGEIVFGAIDITRQEARMLARRINECLDATVRP